MNINTLIILIKEIIKRLSQIISIFLKIFKNFRKINSLINMKTDEIFIPNLTLIKKKKRKLIEDCKCHFPFKMFEI